MIKICHILYELNIGGLEKTVLKVVLGLDRKRFCQEVWCLKNKGMLAQLLEEKGVAVREFGFPEKISLSRLNLLGRQSRNCLKKVC
jgi:hypothetical protein